MLAVYGGYAFAGNPVYDGSVKGITAVNLTTFITTLLSIDDVPFGIDVIYSQRPLTVQKTGSGTGVVQSNVSGIDCGATCTANFNHNYFNGNVITLTATAGPASSFTGWGGDCSGTGACVIDLTEARQYTVTAEFSHNNQWIPFVAFLGEVTTNTLSIQR